MPDSLNSNAGLKNLVVDLANIGLVSKGPAALIEQDVPHCEFCSGEKAIPLLETEEFNSIVVFAERESIMLYRILSTYKQLFGAIPSYQAIFTSSPTPIFTANVFEYGVNLFYSIQNWQAELIYHLKQIQANFTNKFATERKVLVLQKTLNIGDHEKIAKAKTALKDFAEYDYLAAYSYGRALEANGDFKEATTLYENSVAMNDYFIPAQSSLAECLMVVDRMDEALSLYMQLEQKNPHNAARKFLLANAFNELGQFKKAEQIFNDALKIDAECSQRFEAEALLLLKKGHVEEALKKLDFLETAGPFVVAKVNEIGVGLSKEGKGDLALSLYEKVHRIVRPELKYKITLNAALASYRNGQYKQALGFANRCEQEFGSSFKKLDKIKSRIKEALIEAGFPAA